MKAMKSLRKVAIVCKPGKPDMPEILRPLIKWLTDRDFEVVGDSETTRYLPGVPSQPRENLAELQPEFVVVLGGDGTLLSVARAVAEAGVPILAINLGSLGFLTEVALCELYALLEEIVEGVCPLEQRAMLSAELWRGDQLLARFCAMNEAVISKSALARMVGFDIKINGEFAYGARGDGVIVSTPTGSTGYSLSAGGPVVMPLCDVLLITPVCPHSFAQRPLLVSSRDVIEIIIQGRGEEKGCLSIDGQKGHMLEFGDRLICRQAPYGAKLYHANRRYFEILRDKLKWGQN